MAVQALNFTGFIERSELVSYKNLFVSEAPELKGKPLSAFLTNLDNAEYLLVLAENQQVVAAANLQPIEEGFWDKRVIAVNLLTVAYLGITILFYEKLDLLDPNNFYKQTFHVVGFVACAFSYVTLVYLMYAPMYRADERDRQYKDIMDRWDNTVHQINTSRKHRLEEKFNAVRTEYRKLKDASSSLATKSPQQIELREAKRFLKDRVDSVFRHRS